MVYNCHIGIVIVALPVQKIIGKLPFLPVSSYDHLLLKAEGSHAQKHSYKDKRKDKFIEGDTASKYSDKLVVGIEVSQGVGNGEKDRDRKREDYTLWEIEDCNMKNLTQRDSVINIAPQVLEHIQKLQNKDKEEDR